jgi:hypothetical protein
MRLAPWVLNVQPRLTRRELAYARLGAGLTEAEMAHLQAAALPVLLEVLAGRCPWPAWDGWQVGHDGRLYAPGARDGVAPNDVASLHWWRQLVAYWRRQSTIQKETRDETLLATGVGG